MMFFEGNIAAPPTITVFSPDSSLFIIFFSSAVAGATTIVVMASAEKATADNSANRLDMKRLPIGMRAGRHPPALSNDGARSRRRCAELREGFAAVSEKTFSCFVKLFGAMAVYAPRRPGERRDPYTPPPVLNAMPQRSCATITAGGYGSRRCRDGSGANPCCAGSG